MMKQGSLIGVNIELGGHHATRVGRASESSGLWSHRGNFSAPPTQLGVVISLPLRRMIRLLR